jgi:hypothetical protein
MQCQSSQRSSELVREKYPLGPSPRIIYLQRSATQRKLNADRRDEATLDSPQWSPDSVSAVLTPYFGPIYFPPLEDRLLHTSLGSSPRPVAL